MPRVRVCFADVKLFPPGKLRNGLDKLETREIPRDYRYYFLSLSIGFNRLNKSWRAKRYLFPRFELLFRSNLLGFLKYIRFGYKVLVIWKYSYKLIANRSSKSQKIECFNFVVNVF